MLNECIRLDGKFAAAYNARGLIFDKNKNFPASFLDFSKAVELDPKSPIYWHNRACCLKNLGRLKDAIQDFRQAESLDPLNSVILSNLGLVLRKN